MDCTKCLYYGNCKLRKEKPPEQCGESTTFTEEFERQYGQIKRESWRPFVYIKSQGGEVMIVQCAWCNKQLGVKEPVSDKSVSHTICPECVNKYFPDKAKGQIECA